MSVSFKRTLLGSLAALLFASYGSFSVADNLRGARDIRPMAVPEVRESPTKQSAARESPTKQSTGKIVRLAAPKMAAKMKAMNLSKLGQAKTAQRPTVKPINRNNVSEQ